MSEEKSNYLPRSPVKHSRDELNLLSPAVLSFIGDGVETLFARSKVSFESGQKIGYLHKLTARIVSAVDQAKAVKNILVVLTEEETQVYKRCRNAKTNTASKNADIVDYKTASGFEGLIGFLYLADEHERLNELLSIAYSENLIT
ncbi:MAG: ribonuclease III [Christensenellaceae bacterium]|jgi:ribonuclease-3 family protein|nr:ribonuclease III [Christensenellaceae bacterium]